VILHARTPATGQFQHWILFLGFTDYDRVAIYDPPNHRSEISLAELLAVWDGYGIIVSQHPTTTSFSIPYDWLLITAVELAAYFLIRKYVSAFKTIALLSIVGGVAWGLSPHGLLRKPQATGIISARYFPQPIRELTYEEFQLARNEGHSVYVDARPSDSYNALKIPDSINIPVNAGLLQWHEITANYSRDKPMICFCLSKTCGWADAVANQLHHLGFRDVSIYRGGIADWMQHKQPVEN
jgi:rhodanese-related sulfurtransferase